MSNCWSRVPTWKSPTPVPNPPGLRQITAKRGAGFYVDINEADTRGKRLQPDRRERTITRARDAREYGKFPPFLFCFFLVAVPGEWWLRRNNRLV
ncbi:MAG: hypothetical protein CM1200mP2_46850 [Planctomycetaceae bacterium]|nr:MAG: hypothetical protein CM1200mP2_46850 [Planctomycetaceae bacterium]